MAADLVAFGNGIESVLTLAIFVLLLPELTGRKLEVLFAIYVLNGAAMSLLSLAGFSVYPGFRTSGPFFNPNYLAIYLVNSFLFAVAFLYYIVHQKKLKYLLLICVSLIIITIIGTGSRSALLGLAIAIAMFLWKIKKLEFSFRKGVNYLLVGSMIVTLLITWLPGTSRIIQSGLDFMASIVVNQEQKQGIMHRTLLLKAGLNMFLKSPVLGVGYNNFPYNYHRYLPEELAEDWLRAARLDIPQRVTHNDFVKYLAETGVIGFGAYLYLLGVAFFAYRRRFQQLHRAGQRTALLLGGAWAAFIANVIFCLAHNYSNFYFFWITIALPWCLDSSTGTQISER
jgi:O-antigen ligase